MCASTKQLKTMTKTYTCFKHLAPVPDNPVLAGASSSPEPERAPRRPRSANRYKVTSSETDEAPPRPSTVSALPSNRATLRRAEVTSSDTDEAPPRPSTVSALPSNRATLRRAEVTSDDTDNDPESTAASLRSAAYSHFVRHESDLDVMPMDLDEPCPPAVVPTAAETMPDPPCAEPVAPLSLPIPEPPARLRKPRARRAPLPSAPSALPSPRLPPATSPTPPPRRTLRKRSKAQAVQDWAMCGACNSWRAIDAPWKRPTFECLDAGFNCGPCDACSSFPCHCE